MKINIYRESTLQCNHKILIGEFNDLYHPTIFLKGLLSDNLDDEMAGAYVVEYDFTNKEKEGVEDIHKDLGFCSDCRFLEWYMDEDDVRRRCKKEARLFYNEYTEAWGCNEWEGRKEEFYASGFNDAVTEVLRIYDEVENKETFVEQVREMRKRENAEWMDIQTDS